MMKPEFAGIVALLVFSSASANGDRLYLDCPCEIESDGSTVSITADELWAQ